MATCIRVQQRRITQLENVKGKSFIFMLMYVQVVQLLLVTYLCFVNSSGQLYEGSSYVIDIVYLTDIGQISGSGVSRNVNREEPV